MTPMDTTHFKTRSRLFVPGLFDSMHGRDLFDISKFPVFKKNLYEPIKFNPISTNWSKKLTANEMLKVQRSRDYGWSLSLSERLRLPFLSSRDSEGGPVTPNHTVLTTSQFISIVHFIITHRRFKTQQSLKLTLFYWVKVQKRPYLFHRSLLKDFPLHREVTWIPQVFFQKDQITNTKKTKKTTSKPPLKVTRCVSFIKLLLNNIYSRCVSLCRCKCNCRELWTNCSRSETSPLVAVKSDPVLFCAVLVLLKLMSCVGKPEQDKVTQNTTIICVMFKGKH